MASNSSISSAPASTPAVCTMQDLKDGMITELNGYTDATEATRHILKIYPHAEPDVLCQLPQPNRTNRIFGVRADKTGACTTKPVTQLQTEVEKLRSECRDLSLQITQYDRAYLQALSDHNTLLERLNSLSVPDILLAIAGLGSLFGAGVNAGSDIAIWLALKVPYIRRMFFFSDLDEKIDTIKGKYPQCRDIPFPFFGDPKHEFWKMLTVPVAITAAVSTAGVVYATGDSKDKSPKIHEAAKTAALQHYLDKLTDPGTHSGPSPESTVNSGLCPEYWALTRQKHSLSKKLIDKQLLLMSAYAEDSARLAAELGKRNLDQIEDPDLRKLAEKTLAQLNQDHESTWQTLLAPVKKNELKGREIATEAALAVGAFGIVAIFSHTAYRRLPLFRITHAEREHITRRAERWKTLFERECESQRQRLRSPISRPTPAPVAIREQMRTDLEKYQLGLPLLKELMTHLSPEAREDLQRLLLIWLAIIGVAAGGEFLAGAGGITALESGGATALGVETAVTASVNVRLYQLLSWLR